MLRYSFKANYKDVSCENQLVFSLYSTVQDYLQSWDVECSKLIIILILCSHIMQ